MLCRIVVLDFIRTIDQTLIFRRTGTEKERRREKESEKERRKITGEKGSRKVEGDP